MFTNFELFQFLLIQLRFLNCSCCALISELIFSNVLNMSSSFRPYQQHQRHLEECIINLDIYIKPCIELGETDYPNFGFLIIEDDFFDVNDENLKFQTEKIRIKDEWLRKLSDFAACLKCLRVLRHPFNKKHTCATNLSYLMHNISKADQVMETKKIYQDDSAPATDQETDMDLPEVDSNSSYSTSLDDESIATSQATSIDRTELDASSTCSTSRDNQDDRDELIMNVNDSLYSMPPSELIQQLKDTELEFMIKQVGSVRLANCPEYVQLLQFVSNISAKYGEFDVKRYLHSVHHLDEEINKMANTVIEQFKQKSTKKFGN